jgi:DNA gyrase subunit A
VHILSSNVRITPIEKTMSKSYLEYSMSVITSRALPHVRDGLKPVHRRILWSMHNLGLVHNRPPRKCARTIGETHAKYHPHGETAVYDALVRMAQPFSLINSRSGQFREYGWTTCSCSAIH